MNILFPVAVLLVAAAVVTLFLQTKKHETAARTWARTHALKVTPETRPIVTSYLRNSRDLRWAGAIGALFIAAAVTAGTGLDLHVLGVAWILGGYVMGALIAELSLAHVPSTGSRSASLETRRLRDYLPWPMIVAQIVLPIAAVALALVSFVVDPTAAAGVSMGSFVGGSPEIARTGAVNTGIVAALLMVAIAVSQRLLLRRSQPLCPPDELAIDDAMRSSSIHLVGGAGLVVAALTMTDQFTYLANLTTDTLQSALQLAGGGCMFATVVMWRGWAHRSPSPRRRLIVASPAAPVATSGQAHARG